MTNFYFWSHVAITNISKFSQYFILFLWSMLRMKTLPYIVLNSLGLPSLKISLLQYFIEKALLHIYNWLQNKSFLFRILSILIAVSFRKTFLYTNPNFSISFSLIDKVFGLIPSIELINLLNLVLLLINHIFLIKIVNFLLIFQKYYLLDNI